MAEFEVAIQSSRGKFTHEPKALQGGENCIVVGNKVLKIGAALDFGSIALNPDPCFSLKSLTDERNVTTLYPDDRSPYLALKPGETAQITIDPQTYRGIKRYVHITRTV